MPIPAYLLNLAGEYRVCSELNKRGVFATVTYGNRKNVDVYAISDARNRSLKIEVKTSRTQRFVTKITQKFLVCQPELNPVVSQLGIDALWEAILNDCDPQAPDFWVLFQMIRHEDDRFEERFFVLTHREICQAQVGLNKLWESEFSIRNGHTFDFSQGVDAVTVEAVRNYEGQWSRIVSRLASS